MLTPGSRHEQAARLNLLDAGAVNRPGRGRPQRWPQRVARDKGDRNRKARAALRHRGIGTVIPRKRNVRRTGRFDQAADRKRTAVERLINRLTQHWAIATRHDQPDDHYRAFLLIACVLLWA